MIRRNAYMVRAEEARAAWLQLPHFAAPVYVRETDVGFTIGPCRQTGRGGRRPAVLAGYFDRHVEFDDFHDAVEAAAAEAIQLGRSAA